MQQSRLVAGRDDVEAVAGEPLQAGAHAARAVPGARLDEHARVRGRAARRAAARTQAGRARSGCRRGRPARRRPSTVATGTRRTREPVVDPDRLAAVHAERARERPRQRDGAREMRCAGRRARAAARRPAPPGARSPPIRSAGWVDPRGPSASRARSTSGAAARTPGSRCDPPRQRGRRSRVGRARPPAAGRCR